MANPKRRHSNMRTRLRRSHDALAMKSLSKCSNCGAWIVPHRVCPLCGHYRGKQVLTLKVKESKEK
ncbi:MAG: 50S ribosomal protein L32 [Candidatus Omnitrophota bacterium]